MDDRNQNSTEASDVAALACATTASMNAERPEDGSSTPYVIVPSGYQVQDLEHLFSQPARAKGSTQLRDVQSFIAFVQQRRSAATSLYGTVEPPSFKAVFNDDGSELVGPGWKDHTANYPCPLSREWRTWTAHSGKSMTQEAFATFIEDNAPDCVEPPAADMIQIARTLEAKKKVNFASAVRLDNGQTDFTYEEDIQGTAAKGKLQIPQVFTVGLPVLEGGPKYALSARLRYRIGEKGLLSLWFDLERPHKLVEHAVAEVRIQIETETGLRVFNGG